MAWRWLRHIKNDNIEYTFAVPYWNFTVESATFFTHGIGGENTNPTAYAEGQAAITFTSGQENVDNIAFEYTAPFTFTVPSKTAGKAVQWEFGSGYPWWGSFKAWAIRNYTTRTNITGASTTIPFLSNSDGTWTIHDGAIYLCCALNDETEEAYLGIICQQQFWYYDDPTARYSRAWQYTYMCCANGSNIYDIIASSESGGGGGGSNPYGDDDYDEAIGGDGDHDETSDVIDTSPIPIAAATRCGMVTAFVPTWGEIQSVADALLDPNIFQVLSSTVVRAADVIIGLSTFPCTVPATNTATVTANFLGLNIGTGVVAHVADDQYLEVNCGDLTINEYWGNCLDYNPYTNVSIFLPFCGMYELDVDEVMGKTLNVTYRVDIFSGACLATIKIGGSVFYQYTGQCSSQIPLNSVSFDNFLSSMLDIGIATATGVAAVKGAAGAVAESEKAFSDAKTSEVKGALEDVFAARDKYTKVKENSGANMLNAAVSSVIGGKGQYSHAGAMGGSPGFLAVKTPFVIIKRPEQVIPSMYGKFHGYPANTTANLGDLSGYTVVSDIRLNIPDATVDEIIECEQLLKGGVVL